MAGQGGGDSRRGEAGEQLHWVGLAALEGLHNRCRSIHKLIAYITGSCTQPEPAQNESFPPLSPNKPVSHPNPPPPPPTLSAIDKVEALLALFDRQDDWLEKRMAGAKKRGYGEAEVATEMENAAKEQDADMKRMKATLFLERERIECIALCAKLERIECVALRAKLVLFTPKK